MTRLNTGEWKGRFSLLPYRAVGVERGVLLAVRMDRVIIGEREEGTLVALSPTPVSDGGGYRVLTGGW
jgi:stage II sporulation protein GA (sporulation sigma-E factor processing peptidase)